jgi:hypothetical protein
MPHLLFPTLFRFSLADRSVNEPAEMPELEFPRRTLAFLLDRAFSYAPAPVIRSTPRIAVSEKKQHLSLDMNRNFSTALLKALYSLERSP